MTPDHDHDVVVHQFTAVDALTGAPIGERWSVWCGRESEGSFDSEGDAFAAARSVADEHDAPIWLIQHGRTPTLLTSR